MIAARVEIRGLDDVLRTLEAAPKEMRAVAKKSMSAASKATARTLKQRTPKRWRGLVDYQVAVNRKTGQVSARMGYYNAKQAKGKQPKDADRAFDWYKAYWSNYGTLTKRDPNHYFRSPVNPSHYAAAKRRVNRMGIPARHFFENAISGWENTFLAAFQSAFNKNFDKVTGQ